jgi:hypothetical protein
MNDKFTLKDIRDYPLFHKNKKYFVVNIFGDDYFFDARLIDYKKIEDENIKIPPGSLCSWNLDLIEIHSKENDYHASDMREIRKEAYDLYFEKLQTGEARIFIHIWIRYFEKGDKDIHGYNKPTDIKYGVSNTLESKMIIE